jgi:hypothetical protein
MTSVKGWIEDINSGINNWNGITSNSTGQYIVAYTDNNIYYSIDNGTNWNISTGNPTLNITSICSSDDGSIVYISIGTSASLSPTNISGSIWKSIDYGATFIITSSPIIEWTCIRCSFDGKIIIGCNFSDNSDIYSSIDFGLIWTVLDTSNTKTLQQSAQYINKVPPSQIDISNNDPSLLQENININQQYNYVPWSCLACSPDCTTIYAGQYGGYLFLSINSGDGFKNISINTSSSLTLNSKIETNLFISLACASLDGTNYSTIYAITMNNTIIDKDNSPQYPTTTDLNNNIDQNIDNEDTLNNINSNNNESLNTDVDTNNEKHTIGFTYDNEEINNQQLSSSLSLYSSEFYNSCSCSCNTSSNIFQNTSSNNNNISQILKSNNFGDPLIPISTPLGNLIQIVSSQNGLIVSVIAKNYYTYISNNGGDTWIQQLLVNKIPALSLATNIDSTQLTLGGLSTNIWTYFN